MTSLVLSQIGIYNCSMQAESLLVSYTWLQEASRMRALVSLSVVFFIFFSLPLRLARAWHSVTVIKGR